MPTRWEYRTKSISGQNSARAIETVQNDYRIFDRGVLRKSLAHRCSRSVVTGRKGCTALLAKEEQVMELVTQGKTNKEITAVLGFSRAAVKNDMNHVYEKLQATLRAQAAASFLIRIRAKNGIGIAGLGGSPPA